MNRTIVKRRIMASKHIRAETAGTSIIVETFILKVA